MASESQHVERVLETLHDPGAAARSRLAASWRRSLDRHGLDPAQREAVRRVTGEELAEHRRRSEEMMSVSAPALDMLFQLVGSSGCGVLLTDADGVVLDLRAADGDRGIFEAWGLAPGSDWSEASEGTNGIGTCITEARRVIIHRDQHFRARNTAMSCMDAPIFGPEGELMGALDVSSARADQTESFNRLIAAMVAQTARQIEAGIFRTAFPTARIVIAQGNATDEAVLLAIDGNDLVVGATRAARRAFGLASIGAIKPLPATDLFERESPASAFEKAERAAVIGALARASGNVTLAARSLGVGRATLYRRMKRLGIGETHG